MQALLFSFRLAMKKTGRRCCVLQLWPSGTCWATRRGDTHRFFFWKWGGTYQIMRYTTTTHSLSSWAATAILDIFPLLRFLYKVWLCRIYLIVHKQSLPSSVVVVDIFHCVSIAAWLVSLRRDLHVRNKHITWSQFSPFIASFWK